MRREGKGVVSVIPRLCLTVCLLVFSAMVISGCASAPENDPEALAEYEKLNDPMEVANRGITANIVAPGFIRTAMTDALSESQREVLLDRVPVGGFGEPGDISAAVVYLASQEASYVTGTTIHVNGGMAML